MFRTSRQSQAVDAAPGDGASPAGMRAAVIPALALLASRVASTTASAAGSAAFRAAVAAKVAKKFAETAGAETAQAAEPTDKAASKASDKVHAPAKAAALPQPKRARGRKKWLVLALLAGVGAAIVALKTKKEQPADPWAAPTLTPPPSAPSAPEAAAPEPAPEPAAEVVPSDPDEEAELDTWADESPAEMDSPFQEGTEVPKEPGN